MSVSYSAFLDEVMADVPGVPYQLALNQVRNAAIDFCQKSLIYQADATPVLLVDSQTTYAFAPPTGYLVERVMEAWVNGDRPLSEMSVHELNRKYRDWQNTSQVYAPLPSFFTQIDPLNFILVPMPKNLAPADATNPLSNYVTMRLALKPTRASTTIDDSIYQEWLEPIAHGAKARLMAVPGKPYTNPQAATLHITAYEAGVNRARQKARRAWTRTDMQVDIPYL